MRIFFNGVCQCGSMFFDNIKYFDTLDEYFKYFAMSSMYMKKVGCNDIKIFLKVINVILKRTIIVVVNTESSGFVAVVKH
jgi:hypothetical protein